MAGYDWSRGKSRNAVRAEQDGKLPITRAVREVALLTGCKHAKARNTLLSIGPCEWHHSSKYFNRVDYYDVELAADIIRCEPMVRVLAALRLDERISEAIVAGDRSASGGDSRLECRLAARQAEAHRIAAEACAHGVDVDSEFVIDAYYGNYRDALGLADCEVNHGS